MKAIILMAVLLVGFTACTTEYQEETKTTTKYFSFEPTTPKEGSNVHIMELTLMRAEREMRTGEFDKNDFDDLDRQLERFFPDTLVVAKGDTVAISFISEKPNTILVNGKGYSAKSGTYYFEAEKTGSYTIECADCADNPRAIIRVV